MKPLLTLALVASLGLNAALTYFALSNSAPAENETVAQAAAAAEAARAANPGAPPPVDPQTWAALNTTELPQLIARLRSAGFPPEVIRAIIRGMLDEQFAARRRALDPEGEKRAFWKNQPPDNKLQIAMNRLYREQNKMMQDLLGDDAMALDALTQVQQQKQYSYLPPEKISALQGLLRAHGEKQTDLYFQKGTISQEDMQALDRDLQRNIAALLTPAELDEYTMRSSNTARSLRNELMAFNPTEEEFRALVKLRLPYDQEFGGFSGFPNRELQQRQQDADQKYVEQATALLGAQRAEDFTRARNYSYRQTAQLVARLELPPETTNDLYSIQQDFNKRRAELARTYASSPTPGSPPVVPEELSRGLAALQQEAVAKVTPILGSASRVEAYKQYGGGWINNLIPPPRPPATGGK